MTRFTPSCCAELDRYGRTRPELFDRINLRLAHSVTARNALAIGSNDGAREIATMLYGEVRPSGHFRFVNFGHPPPLIFSSREGRFTRVDPGRMVQFLPLGLEVPEDHPDRKRYSSMAFRQRRPAIRMSRRSRSVVRATSSSCIPMASTTAETRKNASRWKN